MYRKSPISLLFGISVEAHGSALKVGLRLLTSVEIEKTSRDDFGRWSWQPLCDAAVEG